MRTKNQLQELSAYINDKDFIAFDVETTGLLEEDKIIGFSISAEVNIAYYVIISYWDVKKEQLIDLETKPMVSEFIKKLVNKNLIMHNATFDCWMVECNYKISLIDSVHTDTLLLGHILDENRSNALKELGVSLFGEEAKDEQKLMKESIIKNNGKCTKEHYELYKADADLIANYGAKDAILTLKIFYVFLDEIAQNESLFEFFYDKEVMPQLKGPTYHLNTTGLKIDLDKLNNLQSALEASCLELKSFIYKEITPLVSSKYPGDKKNNTFNIGSTKQLSWLIFYKLQNDFYTLTKEGKNLCKALNLKIPYTKYDKQRLMAFLEQNKGNTYEEARYNSKTQKMSRPKKIGDPWIYLSADKATLANLSDKYTWVQKYLEYVKNLKLLNTYVLGIKSRMQYNIIRPRFLQHGTTSGRYSSRDPNFQNLPRDDKRVKACIVSRPGKVFVGADYSQLEPRVFASLSNDTKLIDCFTKGEDFYSVIGMEVFDKYDCTLKKEDGNSFAKKYPELRNIAKTIALSATYGTTAAKMAPLIKKPTQEAQYIIDNYFERFPSVKNLMLESHKMVKKEGIVYNIYGRPRRIPKAKAIQSIYGNISHEELPYEMRNMLNLSINHRIQSTGASIINRAAIQCCVKFKENATINPEWLKVRIVMQVHDELIIEGPSELADEIASILKHCMENAIILPNVSLVADPKIANNLADLK